MEDKPKRFIQELIKIRDEFEISPRCEINMTANDVIKHKQVTKCCHCGKEFTKEDHKVRDHNHFNGNYKWALHNSCNKNIQDGRFIPIFLHNLKGYDSHLIIRAFHDLEKVPDAIPLNSEKFTSFSLHQKKGFELRFLDSMGFINYSLASLAKNLKEFLNLSKTFGKEMAKDLSRKGVFPYEWFDDRLSGL